MLHSETSTDNDNIAEAFARIHAELADLVAEHRSMARQVRVLSLSTRQLVVRVDRLEQALDRASD